MELLAPAGNLNKLKIAVLYGADAVYLAGPKYGLRSASDNFSDTELCEGIQFAHQNISILLDICGIQSLRKKQFSMHLIKLKNVR